MIDARQTNRRLGEEWYECMRCGFPYPRRSVIVQNGMTLCHGQNTIHCYDEQGYEALYKQSVIDLPREQPIPPLPEVSEDL